MRDSRRGPEVVSVTRRERYWSGAGVVLPPGPSVTGVAGEALSRHGVVPYRVDRLVFGLGLLEHKAGNGHRPGQVAGQAPNSEVGKAIAPTMRGDARRARLTA